MVKAHGKLPKLQHFLPKNPIRDNFTHTKYNFNKKFSQKWILPCKTSRISLRTHFTNSNSRLGIPRSRRENEKRPGKTSQEKFSFVRLRSRKKFKWSKQDNFVCPLISNLIQLWQKILLCIRARELEELFRHYRGSWARGYRFWSRWNFWRFQFGKPIVFLDGPCWTRIINRMAIGG